MIFIDNQPAQTQKQSGISDQMSDWQLYQLLAQILGGADLELHVAQANQADCWADIFLLSSHHLVTTQLYWVLSHNDRAWKLLDAEQQGYLEEIFSLNRSRNKQLVGEVEPIVLALNEAGITPLLAKGTALLFARENPSSGYRMQLDADLLVQKQDLDTAADILVGMDYKYAEELVSGLSPVVDQRRSRLMSIYKHHQHLPPFIHQNKRTVIELHRHLYSERFQKYYPLDSLFERAKLVSGNGINWYQMSMADEFQHLLTQGYMDPGFKRSYYLPLRLGCDFLDLQKRVSKLAATPPSTNKKLARTHFFAQQLIEHIFLPSAETKRQNNKPVRRYIKRMRDASEKPFLGMLVNAYASFIRKIINLAHNPRLIQRRF